MPSDNRRRELGRDCQAFLRLPPPASVSAASLCVPAGGDRQGQTRRRAVDPAWHRPFADTRAILPIRSYLRETDLDGHGGASRAWMTSPAPPPNEYRATG